MKADYDFPVELQSITTEPGGLIVPNRLAVVRTDTMKPIGLVSKKYTLLAAIHSRHDSHQRSPSVPFCGMVPAPIWHFPSR